MSMNKPDQQKAIEEARQRGFKPTSDGSGLTNGQTKIKTTEGGSIQTDKGDKYTDLSGFKKSKNWG